MSDSTSYLPPGTICVLTRCVDDPALNGRVVTITGGPTCLDEPGETFYAYDAAWARQENPRAQFFALRRCLRPITWPSADASDLESERPAEGHYPTSQLFAEQIPSGHSE